MTFYEMSEQHHKNFLMITNVTKIYKKAPAKLETSINLEAQISDLMNLDDRIESIARTPAFITLQKTIFSIN